MVEDAKYLDLEKKYLALERQYLDLEGKYIALEAKAAGKPGATGKIREPEILVIKNPAVVEEKKAQTGGVKSENPNEPPAWR